VKRNYNWKIFKGKNGAWFFHFAASNGNIVGDQYKTKRNAKKSLMAFVEAVREGRLVAK